MKIKIVNKSHHPLPAYVTELSAGMDLCANIDETERGEGGYGQLV
jgi:dUTP pyrophosphatase